MLVKYYKNDPINRSFNISKLILELKVCYYYFTVIFICLKLNTNRTFQRITKRVFGQMFGRIEGMSTNAAGHAKGMGKGETKIILIDFGACNRLLQRKLVGNWNIYLHMSNTTNTWQLKILNTLI